MDHTQHIAHIAPPTATVGRPSKHSAVLAALLGHPPIAFHYALGPIAGGATPALLLSHLCYLDYRADADGWFDQSDTEITRFTCLTYHEQRTARRRLVRAGLIHVKHGRHKRTLFRVDFEAIEAAITAQFRGKRGSANSAESAPHIPRKARICTSYKEISSSSSRSMPLLPLVLDLHKNQFGSRLTRTLQPAFEEFLVGHPMLTDPDVRLAFREAAEHGGKPWKYIASILDRLSKPEPVAVTVQPHDAGNPACPCLPCEGSRQYGGGADAR